MTLGKSDHHLWPCSSGAKCLVPCKDCPFAVKQRAFLRWLKKINRGNAPQENSSE